MKWQTFCYLLNTSVHDSNLSDVQKFSDLNENLEGDALNAISGLAPNFQNYTQALEVLEKRFGNPQLMILSRINTLVELPTNQEQDGVNGLRTYDQINLHFRSLSTVCVASEHYGPMLSSSVLEKLPPEIF